MNLPLVIDIAIGLIFIYLIFSLLTSELLELITTVLQWRAVHLKESIEGLLAGSNETPELQQARILANRLYSNPVINTLNQEAKGFAASLPRRLNQTIGRFFRALFKRENVFADKNSGPSYISSESFAISLLETLGIPTVIQKFTVLRMQEFKAELIDQVETTLQPALPGINKTTLSLDFKNPEEEARIRDFLKGESQVNESNIEQVFYVLKKNNGFKKKLDDTVEGFNLGGFDLIECINRLEEVCNRNLEDLEEYFQKVDFYPNDLIDNLKALRNETFGKPQNDSLDGSTSFSREKALLLRNLRPSLTEAVEIVQGFWQIKICWSIYKEVRRSAALEAIAKIRNTLESSTSGLPDSIKQDLLNKLENLTNTSSGYGYERIRRKILDFPKLNPSIKQSLVSQINTIVETSYREIREFIEVQQEPELPPAIKNLLLQKVDEAASGSSTISSLSYEFARIRRAEFEKIRERLETKTDASEDIPTVIIDTIDDIIERTNAAIKNSYDNIREAINNETRLPTPARDSLLDLISEISSVSLNFEYTTVRKFIQERPNLPDSVKSNLLREIDQTINESLSDEYESFRKAVERQPNLNVPVKQSLLLLATAITLRKDNELAQLVDRLLGMGSLPDSVERNLLLLAQQAQIKVEGVKEELNQFRREIEDWFDRSMERASGVYKRNAKLVAIVIGSLVAVGINADTVHMVTRLSKDQILRSTVTRAADQIATQDSDTTTRCLSYPTQAQRLTDPDCNKSVNQLDRATENIALPIGWGESNRFQQWDEGESLGGLRFLRYLLGWFVSGIAFSMGASFWYEVLNKFINIRNTGRPPRPSRTSSDSDEVNPSA